MLELVLDKEFVNTFHLAYKGKEEYVEDFRKYFLKNLQKLTLVSNYLDLHEIEKEVKGKDNPLLELIIEHVDKFIFCSDLLTQIDSPEFPVTGSPFKIILTGENTATCTSRRKRFGLEYLNPENLSDRWQLYFSQRIDINKKTTDDTEIPANFRFDSWECLKPFIHPLNAIIIVDFYLLNWEREAELTSNLDNNITPLLFNLLSQASSEIPVELTFVSEFKDKLPIKQNERVNTSISRIEEAIIKITSKPFKLNIIVHKKDKYPKDFQEFHDRIIVTNYFYINSGAGFTIRSRNSGINIFKNSGEIFKIRHNTEVHFRSILNILNFWSAFKDLKQLDIYCKRLENHPGLTDYVSYCPSKTNRLLNIEHS